MTRRRFLLVPAVLSAVLLVGCGNTPSPVPPVDSGSPGPGPSIDGSFAPPPPTEVAVTPIPSDAAAASPSLAPAAVVALPMRDSVKALGTQVIQMAPGAGGTLFVLIPVPSGSVLVLLDRNGKPRQGWPVKVGDATSCDVPMPVADGSVRLVCTMANPQGNMFDPMSAFAFDPTGHSLTGWPVDLPYSWVTARVVGSDLALFALTPLGDVIPEGEPSAEGTLVTVAPNSAIRSGVPVPQGEACCGESAAVGPDGVAYGVGFTGEAEPGAKQAGRISAQDASGTRKGWPVKFSGVPSTPAFVSAADRTVVLVGTPDAKTSRVLAFGPKGKAVSGRSAKLRLPTIESSVPGDCTASTPRQPVVAKDGTVFLYSEIDTAVLALTPTLAVKRGWPFKVATGLVRPRPGSESQHEAGYCPPPVVPAVAPDGTLYLSMKARKASVGGSLVAVGSKGRVRGGWPVVLKRPGAEFWSVAVGPDGTAYALAIEPEAGDAQSASILAVAPDSQILYRTTIVEP